ncbi:unnamed protein product [Paramecium sonneborni]|uniref:Uncharacterized protein n=1 Tax=Paramecium sonneborni TaxID=65129 RepID=A0A8S1L372_9CILI|nr:unnamed protein product [Paramecium sonneborni]
MKWILKHQYNLLKEIRHQMYQQEYLIISYYINKQLKLKSEVWIVKKTNQIKRQLRRNNLKFIKQVFIKKFQKEKWMGSKIKNAEDIINKKVNLIDEKQR